MKKIREIQKVIQSSLFLMIIVPSTIFSLGMILSWIVGFLEQPTKLDLILNPIAGGFIGVIGHVYLKEEKKIKEREEKKTEKEK